jgi:signal transduction histidine kinase
MDFNAVAHDLRTPLNVMLGHMRLLAREGLSDTDRHRLEVVEAQIHRMTRLLDTYGRQHPLMPRVTQVNLDVLIENVISELDALVQSHGIELAFTIDEALPCIVGDRDLLHRVMSNLLVNAVDAIAGSGRIEIVARMEETLDSRVRTIHIEVADTGGGIAGHLITRVFEPGFTTKPCRGSHGLGLSICREIIQMHGGDIGLTSELGHGTTVRLSLPVKS